MREHTLKLVAVSAFLGGALVGAAALHLAAAGAPSHHHAQQEPTQAADPRPFVVAMDRDMATMMRDMHAPGYTGDWDVDFLAMMIPHHQGAIDMAKLVLLYGEDPLTRSVAEEIIASQQIEIDAMSARLRMLRAESTPGANEFPALSGTRGGSR